MFLLKLTTCGSLRLDSNITTAPLLQDEDIAFVSLRIPQSIGLRLRAF